MAQTMNSLLPNPDLNRRKEEILIVILAMPFINYVIQVKLSKPYEPQYLNLEIGNRVIIL